MKLVQHISQCHSINRVKQTLSVARVVLARYRATADNPGVPPYPNSVRRAATLSIACQKWLGTWGSSA